MYKYAYVYMYLYRNKLCLASGHDSELLNHAGVCMSYNATWDHLLARKICSVRFRVVTGFGRTII